MASLRLARPVRFQSTPPVAGERSQAQTDAARIEAVSIHAPRCRGAKPDQRQGADDEDAVSIHAPRCRGAKPPSYLAASRLWLGFNPRPPLPGSEAIKISRLRMSPPCFNPRPPLPGSEALAAFFFAGGAAVSIHAPRCRGAKRLDADVLGNGLRVSIHAPRCRGAKRQRRQYLFRRHVRFNPRPPLPVSEAADQQKMLQRRLVSIHAPRCRGAKPRYAGHRRRWRPVSIHAPRCRGAKPLVEQPYRTTSMFQSTPPVAGERSKSRFGVLPVIGVFQSTPPVAGE